MSKLRIGDRIRLKAYEGYDTSKLEAVYETVAEGVVTRIADSYNFGVSVVLDNKETYYLEEYEAPEILDVETCTHCGGRGFVVVEGGTQ